ncbi:hypothetical protein [Geobacter sp.]|uniref:RCC1 domain-containing protein n=1 Tax=Geobacter sp. TaxID=46610 RepID=UPI00262402EB|nr:hypothetical protein [Geobacter sp.]
MKNGLCKLAPLLGLAILAGCASGEPPARDSTELSAPFNAQSVIFKNNSSAWIMGNDGSGQLGNGSTTNLATPAVLKLPFSLDGNRSAVSVGGSHTLAFQRQAMANYSTVWAWGSNGAGQLGRSPASLGMSSTPVKVGGFSAPITAVAAGGTHSLALDANGAVWAWGGNTYGQAAFNNLSTVRSVPAMVPNLGIAASGIAAGGSHSISFNATQVMAWGRNANGQLGNGSTTDSITPVLVQGLSGVTKIAAGGSHNLALVGSGQLWAWGYNGFGQLGDATTVDHTAPELIVIPGNLTVIDIGAGSDHSVVVTSDGRVWTWGYNLAGQLGYATLPNQYLPSPTRIESDENGSPFDNVARIVLVGGHHTIVQKGDGTYWAWGYNGFGQLGDGTTTNRFAPRQITLP